MLQFWFRQSPQPIVSANRAARCSWNSPPYWGSGMAGVRLDLAAGWSRYSVPPQREAEAAAPPAEPDWSRSSPRRASTPRLRPVEPRWTPPFYCDRRAAWEGTWPRRPDVPLRVEAAAYRGRPVWFQIVQPWTRPERMQPFQRTARRAVGQAINILILARPGRRRRADGAPPRARSAAATGTEPLRVAFALRPRRRGGLLIAAHHVRDRVEMGLIGLGGGAASLLFAAVLWVFYLALEPYARRMWPHALISWARLLAGGWRDPAWAATCSSARRSRPC